MTSTLRTCLDVAVLSSVVPKRSLTTVRKMFLVLRNPETSFLSCSYRSFLSSNASLLCLDSLLGDDGDDEAELADDANAVATVIPRITQIVSNFITVKGKNSIQLIQNFFFIQLTLVLTSCVSGEDGKLKEKQQMKREEMAKRKKSL